MTKPQLLGLYALTLLNPWAALIAHGTKRVENRGWRPYDDTNQIFIHAGKSWDQNAGRIILEHADTVELGTTSAIVAVADLAHVCSASRWTPEVVCGCGEWAVAGQCHWRLGTVWTLPAPVPAVGRQGLWRPEPSALDAVRRQLEAMPR